MEKVTTPQCYKWFNEFKTSKNSQWPVYDVWYASAGKLHSIIERGNMEIMEAYS